MFVVSLIKVLHVKQSCTVAGPNAIILSWRFLPQRQLRQFYVQNMPRVCYAYLVATSQQPLEPIKQHTSMAFRLKLDKRESKVSGNVHCACNPKCRKCHKGVGGGALFLWISEGLHEFPQLRQNQGWILVCISLPQKGTFLNRHRCPKMCLLEADGGECPDIPHI